MKLDGRGGSGYILETKPADSLICQAVSGLPLQTETFKRLPCLTAWGAFLIYEILICFASTKNYLKNQLPPVIPLTTSCLPSAT